MSSAVGEAVTTKNVISAMEDLPHPAGPAAASVGLVVEHLGVRAGRTQIIEDISFEVRAGELFAIAGVSGAGKSTLLEALAEVRATTSGAVRFVADGAGGVDVPRVAFVPQDDIIHHGLPLRTTLHYAARLRLPATARAEVDAAVDRVLRELRLEGCAAVRVGDLSGGQRKRACIAAELLTRPDLLLLDEPTSGLDPATAAEVLTILRTLTRAGTTVVVTTHHLDELECADRFAFLGSGGRLTFVGSSAQARAALGGAQLTALYQGAVPDRSDVAPRLPAPVPGPRAVAGSSAPPRRPGAGAVRRWWVLTRRNVALLRANRLTMAIVFGSPALVIAMMVILFPPASGASGASGASAATRAELAVQLPFWLAFAAFFFGLTAGLLQIVPEAAIAAREQRAGVGPITYVLSKVGALAPALVVVSLAMLVALRGFDRLPVEAGWSPVALVASVLFTAASALALGLLASALVRDAAQASLALPMLCFPQVLFAGAVVGVAQMASVGRALSNGMSTRFGFEGILASLGAGSSPVGAWLVLASFTVALLGATVVAVRARR